MTTFDTVALVVSVFVMIPLGYLLVSYVVWRENDQLRRDIRQVERNLRNARGQA